MPERVEKHPCEMECPLDVPVRKFTGMVAEGKFENAFNIIRSQNPLPSVAGRLCTAPCECACLRKDEPVAVKNLERFVGDTACEKNFALSENPAPIKSTHHVAVVGAGPTGLTCAHHLHQVGVKVTVYDPYPRPGGTLAYIVPSFVLPKDFLFCEIMRMEKAGIKFVLNSTPGKDISIAHLRATYDAVFLAFEAMKSEPPPLPGRESIGVMTTAEFLIGYHSNNLPIATSRIAQAVVVGIDEEAIYAARLLKRLGAVGVLVVTELNDEQIPERTKKLLKSEQIDLLTQTRITSIYSTGGQVSALRGVKIEHHGKTTAVAGSEFEIGCNLVCFSTPRTPDYSVIENEKSSFRFSPSGKLWIDRNFQTNIYGIFAGGEFVLGASDFLTCATHGKKAAVAIAKFLGIELERSSGEIFNLPDENWPPLPRYKLSRRHMESCVGDFREITIGYDEQTAQKEAQRCVCPPE